MPTLSDRKRRQMPGGMPRGMFKLRFDWYTIISYPTSVTGIIVLLKTPPIYNNNKKAQKITHMLTIFFLDHGIMAHIP